MKKQIIVAVASVLLSALILLLLPQPVEELTVPSAPSAPSTPSASGPITDNPTDPGFSTVPQAPGVVRLYTCDAEQQAAYAGFAAEYYARTGQEVIVMGPGEEDCEVALARLLESDEAPTIFCIHTQEAFARWEDRLYDLTGTDVAAALYSADFGLKSGDRLVGLAADVEGFGLLYNAALLASTGFSRTDVDSFDALSTIVRYITDSGFGFSAFGMPDWTDDSAGSCLSLLAGMCPDAGELREFMDMYRKGCLKNSTAAEAFMKEKTVFYLGGIWDYERVSGLADQHLDILPAYTPEGGMRYLCHAYWCVNGDSREADIQVSLDFLKWMVTASAEEAAPVDRLGLFAPFRDAQLSDNPLEKKLRGYMQKEPAILVWDCQAENLAAFGQSLEAYMTSATDENWSAVAAWLEENT